jgi:uncharacterized protein (DUF2141 family)
MKKLILLIVLILLAIFILSPPVSAIIWIHVSPPPPAKVNYCDNITINWFFNRTAENEDYYYLIIHERNKPEREYKNQTFLIPQGKKEIRNSMTWHISKNLPDGKYIAIVRYRDKQAQEPFWVGIGGNLCIKKFNDSNQNKMQDLDEHGLAGWEFTIKYIDDPTAEPFVMTTGSDGRTCTGYRLEVGNYTITEKKKEEGCWMNTKPLSQGAVVIENKTITVDFGNCEVGTLKIIKFNDTNGNGELDDKETLPGWEFNVTAPDGKTTKYTTDNDGEIKIEVPPGSYVVEEILKDNWTAITPITKTVKIKKCEVTPVKFCNRPRTVPLMISKFYDQNQNGNKDSGEKGIADWKFEITQDGRRVTTGKTDKDGIWAVQGLSDGDYTISEIEKPNHCWKNSTTTSHGVTVRRGNSLKEEFGNYEIGTLYIHKFNDTNHNGEWNDGELPLPNWGFRIKDPDGVIDITRYTADDGSIKVELPANVRYNASDTLLVGWRNSTPLMQYADIKPCEDSYLTFGNYNYSEIIIYKFNDVNKNGIKEENEEPLTGWDFWISGPSVNERITTDKNGKAIFRDVIPGRYKIEELIRADQREEGWKVTTPRIWVDEVGEGQTVTVEFGNRLVLNKCIEYAIYVPLDEAPRWHRNSDENLNVTKYLDPRVVYCLDPDAGEIINVSLRVCVFPMMAPTDIVLAVDTSGSVVETGGGPLEVMRDGVTEFIQKNKARFGENVRIGLVNWDDDIDETVNLTTDYDEIKKACGTFSGNLQEFTLYQVGLNGGLEVFNRSPRDEKVKKIIVFVTDAKGEYRNITRFPDPEEYTIYSITIGPTQNEEIFNMLDNFTSQYNGTAVRVNESSEELEKALTTLTVSGIERRTLRNVTVVETLPKYMRALNGSYKKPPTSEHINSDGMEWNTVTMKWDIGDWSSDECWENTFKVLFCCRVPADVTQPEGISRVTSEVTYTDPTNNTITKHLPIPEGGLWIESQVPGFEALFAIAGLLAVGYIMWRRKR